MADELPIGTVRSRDHEGELLHAVESLAVELTEASRASRQIRLGRLDGQMVVIIHQHIGVQRPPKHADRAPQQDQKSPAIHMVPDDRAPFIATGRHMIGSARKFQAERASHKANSIAAHVQVKILDLILCPKSLHLISCAFARCSVRMLS